MVARIVARCKLPPMPSSRPFVVAASLLCSAMFLEGCDRPSGGAPFDSGAVQRAVPVPSAAPGREPTTATTWSDDAGPALVVATDSGRGFVVLPTYTDSTLTDTTTFDLSLVHGTRLDLFSRPGASGEGAVLPVAPRAAAGAGCTSWPDARVTLGDAPFARNWTIGFAAGRARPIPLDPLGALAGPDSARLAAEVTRVASTVPDDAGSIFRGLPFSVRDAWRLQAAPGTEALIAGVMRRINQEANPRVEHLLMVAERDSGTTGGRFRVAYFERTNGLEETLEMSDVLAAVSLGTPPRATIVLARDFGDGAAYALLERTGVRAWRIRWSSAYTGC